MALVWDIRTHKIKNVIVFPFVLAGIATNFLESGVEGAAQSLAAMLVPILLMGVLYALRMLGAGDIKLFCAVGAIMGLEFVLYTTAFSFLAGGCIAVVLLLLRRNAKKRFLHLFHYLKNLFRSFSFVPYTDFQDTSDGGKFPFAIAIFCGAAVESVIRTWFPL